MRTSMFTYTDTQMENFLAIRTAQPGNVRDPEAFSHEIPCGLTKLLVKPDSLPGGRIKLLRLLGVW